MAKVVFGGNAYELKQQESVLIGLERHGVTIPSSCRSGVCQTCLMLAVSGEVPSSSQLGLKPTLQKQNYFLACLCKPENDIEISFPGEDVKRHFYAEVLEKTDLGKDTFRMRLSRDEIFTYYAGQFISLYQSNDVIRSYSLASLPSDPFLEIHVRHLPNGKMTTWLKDQVKIGDEIKIDAAVGDCFYIDDDLQKNMLLVGTGTGLSPLYGIVRDALSKGHRGEIHLYHGSQSPNGIYLENELRALAEQHENFHYVSCVSGALDNSRHQHGRANDIALAVHKNLKGWKIYLCGNPEMVAATKKKGFLAGASLKDIFSDPFIINKSA